MEIGLAVCILTALLLAERAANSNRAGAVVALSGASGDATGPQSPRKARGRPVRWVRASAGSAALATLLGLLGGQAAGPIGFVTGVLGGAIGPALADRRRTRVHGELMERQLAELAESTALAVRSGLSVAQAVEFAHRETAAPMRDAVEEFMAQQRLGTSFEVAIERFGDALGTDDARLLAVILGVHAKAGGNLAGALEEVTATIRHRIALRRELRALSAQGRISGLILASLPLAFSLILATTSRAKLAPIYASPAGMAMVAAGLMMEVLAFLWIRRLLRVDA